MKPAFLQSSTFHMEETDLVSYELVASNSSFPEYISYSFFWPYIIPILDHLPCPVLIH